MATIREYRHSARSEPNMNANKRSLVASEVKFYCSLCRSVFGQCLVARRRHIAHVCMHLQLVRTHLSRFFSLLRQFIGVRLPHIISSGTNAALRSESGSDTCGCAYFDQHRNGWSLIFLRFWLLLPFPVPFLSAFTHCAIG